MIAAQHRLHENLLGHFRRFTVCLIVGVLFFTMPIVTVVQADEPSALKKQTDRPSNVGKNKPRSRRKHRKRRGERKPALHDSDHQSQAQKVRLQLHGTFELDLGSGNLIRGEGTTTMELEPSAIEKMLAMPDQGVDHGPSPQANWTRLILSLPQTVQTTAGILETISDPQTQANLRQVEQLFQLLPRSSAPDATSPH